MPGTAGPQDSAAGQVPRRDLANVDNERLQFLVENLAKREGFANWTIMADELRAMAAELLQRRSQETPT